jgi:hypothetical protein
MCASHYVEVGCVRLLCFEEVFNVTHSHLGGLGRCLERVQAGTLLRRGEHFCDRVPLLPSASGPNGI